MAELTAVGNLITLALICAVFGIAGGFPEWKNGNETVFFQRKKTLKYRGRLAPRKAGRPKGT
ncbi:hypothetical protein [Cucumibacter marinus]|uniref:hypothetical protein n=1 Tax=Cucumibacter marinus TaxID=1121252 RepID=UPI00048B909A|nr:hypothetical protein [Cucumibacter marinus]